MGDILKTKNNVSRMVEQGAPESEIDEYIALEGYTVDDIKQFKVPEALAYKPGKVKEQGITPPAEMDSGGGFLKENVVRPLARATKTAAVGTLGTLGDLAQTVTAPFQNMASYGLGKAGFPDAARAVAPGISASEATRKAFDNATRGMTVPRNATERVVDKAGEFISGSALGAIKGAQALLPTSIRETLGIGASGVGAGVANEISPDNPIAEFLGAMVGGGITALPSVAKTAAAKVSGVRPEAIQAFDKAGIDPTVAAISGRSAAAVEKSLLSELPGSAGVIQKSSERTLQQMQNAVDRVASTRGIAATPTEAGKALQKGSQGFSDRFTAKSEELYDKLREHIKPSDPVKVDSTNAYLNDIYSRFDELPSLKTAFTDPIIKSAYNDFSKSKAVVNLSTGATERTVKYNTLRRLRTAVGNKMMGQVDGEQRAALTGLYNAISRDLEGAAAAKGEGAVKALNRANAYYSSGMKRREAIIQELEDSGTPEKVFNIAMQGTKQGATTLATIKKSMKPDEFGELQSAVIRQMGKANPGAQDASQNLFSPSSFLTRYSQLSPEAKNVLLGTKGRDLRDSLDNLIAAASNIKNVEKLANNSGTFRPAGWSAAAVGMVKAPAVTLGLLGAGHVTSRMLTNPTFTRWLANGVSKESTQALSQHIGRLSAIAASNPDIRGDIAQYLQSLGGENGTRQ